MCLEDRYSCIDLSFKFEGLLARHRRTYLLSGIIGQVGVESHGAVAMKLPLLLLEGNLRTQILVHFTHIRDDERKQSQVEQLN